MNILKGFEVYIAIADHDGIAPAAEALNMSTSAVSRYLKDLESWAGQQFFTRTTRSISLTEAGKQQLIQARVILEDVKKFQNIEPNRTHDKLVGTIRITAPEFVVKHVLLTPLTQFQAEHPEVNFEIFATDRFVDLIAEGFDVAFRIGALADSNLILRKVRDVQLELIASPEYINAHGEPKYVQELKDHQCIIDTAPSYKSRWPITDKTIKRGISVTGMYQVNGAEMVNNLVLKGVGIGFIPDVLVSEHIKNGQIISLLQNASKHKTSLNLLRPNMAFVPPKVRKFCDHIAKWSYL